MNKTMLLASAVLSLTLTACAPTQTSRATGQIVDDVALTTKVKTELAQAQGIGQAVTINVDTYRGVVALSGFVDSSQQAQSAAQAAARVSGVRRVINNLIPKSQVQ